RIFRAKTAPSTFKGLRRGQSSSTRLRAPFSRTGWGSGSTPSHDRFFISRCPASVHDLAREARSRLSQLEVSARVGRLGLLQRPACLEIHVLVSIASGRAGSRAQGFGSQSGAPNLLTARVIAPCAGRPGEQRLLIRVGSSR